MPKLCDGCAFYCPDNDRTKCPVCDGPLKITFLPPPGEKAAPIAGLPTDPVAELSRRHRAAGGSGVNWLLVKAVCAVLVTAGVAGVRLYLRQEAREEREVQTAAAERIRPGMHISEAARLLEAGSNMPGWRGATRDDFDPDDDSDGTMEVNDGRQDLTITWRDGYVVSVERASESGGTRRRVTQVTARPEIESDGVPEDDDTPRVPKPTGGNR